MKVAVIPAYNEELSIGSVVLKARRYVDEVIVVDDGSEDDTSLVAREAGAKVIRNERNLGKGESLRRALNLLRESKVDVVVLLDADGQHDPDDIPKLVKPIIEGKADMVIGSRKSVREIPLYRRIGQRILDYLTRKAAGAEKSFDSQSGFRALSGKAIRVLKLREKGFAIESEMLVNALKAGLKVVEVPIRCRYDVRGSTLHPLIHGLGVLNSVLSSIVRDRPLLYFGAIGSGLIIGGVIKGLEVLEIFNRTRALAVGTAMISVLLFIIGAISISTGITLYAISALSRELKGE